MITSLIGVVGTTLFLAGPWFAALLIGRTPAAAAPAPAPRTLTTMLRPLPDPDARHQHAQSANTLMLHGEDASHCVCNGTHASVGCWCTRRAVPVILGN